MISHLELSDKEFESLFFDCALEPKLFSQEAHIRLTWIHLKKYGLKQTLKNIPFQLKRYVKQIGAQEKYHASITMGGIYAVHHFMQKKDIGYFKLFLSSYPELETDFKGLINSHYSYDIFSNPEARRIFIEPDVFAFV